VGGACGRNEEKRNMYKLFARKSDGKTPLRKIKRRWADSKMDLVEIE
jgi:hypothetical protein